MVLDIWHIWYLVSMTLLLLEALVIPGAGLLFAAIAALCMGFLVQFHVIDPLNLVAQWTAFFFITALWAAILWKPFKRLRTKKSNTERHHDVIGRFAVVADGGIQKGRKGGATWSGTVMSARLADDAGIESAEAGQELKIVGILGSTLILAESSYTIHHNDA